MGQPQSPPSFQPARMWWMILLLVAVSLAGLFYFRLRSAQVTVDDHGLHLAGLSSIELRLVQLLRLSAAQTPATLVNGTTQMLSFRAVKDSGDLAWPNASPHAPTVYRVKGQNLLLDPGLDPAQKSAERLSLNAATFGRLDHAERSEPLLAEASDGLRDIRRTWLNTIVYPVGGLTGGCLTGAPALVDDERIDSTQPLRLSMIRRLAQPRLWNMQGGVPGYDGADVLAYSPLVVLVTVEQPVSAQLNRPGCQWSRAVILPSALSLPRVFSHETEVQVLAGAHDPDVRAHWAVAWKRNFPDGDLGSVNDLMHQREWHYRGSDAPVVFTRN